MEVGYTYMSSFMQILHTVSGLEFEKKKKRKRKKNYQLTQLAQVKNRFINKYQCGNDLYCSPLLNNADKCARFDDTNRNG